MTETLRVDTDQLSAAAGKLLSVSEGMPDAPQVGSFSGGDKLSSAISTQASKVVDPVVSKMPEVKEAFSKYADNVGSASSQYETTDEQVAADVRKALAAFDAQFGKDSSTDGGSTTTSGNGNTTKNNGKTKSKGSSTTSGSGSSPSDSSSSGSQSTVDGQSTMQQQMQQSTGSDGMSQMSQFMSMPMQMAQSAMQMPGQMLSSLSQIPQQAMQGAQQIVQASTQGAGEQPGDLKDQNPQDPQNPGEKPGEQPAQAQGAEGKDKDRAPVGAQAQGAQAPGAHPGGVGPEGPPPKDGPPPPKDGPPPREGAGGGVQRAPVGPGSGRHRAPDAGIDV